MAPTMVLLNDPLGDVEPFLDSLGGGPDDGSDGGPRQAAQPNRWMQEYVGSRGGDLNESALPILNGRRCCYDLSRRLERQLHHMRLPARRTCSCGATWSIEMAVRPDQRSNRHGR